MVFNSGPEASTDCKVCGRLSRKRYISLPQACSQWVPSPKRLCFEDGWGDKDTPVPIMGVFWGRDAITFGQRSEEIMEWTLILAKTKVVFNELSFWSEATERVWGILPPVENWITFLANAVKK